MAVLTLAILWFCAAALLALRLGRWLARVKNAPDPSIARPSGPREPKSPPKTPLAEFDRHVRALAQYDEVVAKVAVLRWLGGLDHAAIAAELDTDEATVERCLQLARIPPPQARLEHPTKRTTGADCCRQC